MVYHVFFDSSKKVLIVDNQGLTKLELGLKVSRVMCGHGLHAIFPRYTSFQSEKTGAVCFKRILSTLQWKPGGRDSAKAERILSGSSMTMRGFISTSYRSSLPLVWLLILPIKDSRSSLSSGYLLYLWEFMLQTVILDFRIQPHQTLLPESVLLY